MERRAGNSRAPGQFEHETEFSPEDTVLDSRIARVYTAIISMSSQWQSVQTAEPDDTDNRQTAKTVGCNISLSLAVDTRSNVGLRDPEGLRHVGCCCHRTMVEVCLFVASHDTTLSTHP